eukprot:6464335-Amphidinium_carterae.3
MKRVARGLLQVGLWATALRTVVLILAAYIFLCVPNQGNQDAYQDTGTNLIKQHAPSWMHFRERGALTCSFFRLLGFPSEHVSRNYNLIEFEAGGYLLFLCLPSRGRAAGALEASVMNMLQALRFVTGVPPRAHGRIV